MPERQPFNDVRELLELRVAQLLARMSLAEKIGQLGQVNGAGGHVPEDLRGRVAAGAIGSVLNEVDSHTLHELQHIAVHDSRLGIPLLFGRDVIHGFSTVFPIPLGMAASFDPELVRAAAAAAAREAGAVGLNWTFAPMIDISRDARWGRVAESLGEDPHLAARLGAAMVRGFQGDNLAAPGALAACAKHFAGYGACEAGKDYNTTNIPENELRNVHLAPFRAAIDAGVATVMASFCDLDGVPCTANSWLMRDILRGELDFAGLTVSDWESIPQLVVHGVAADERAAAGAAALAGIDMEMASTTYAEHLEALVGSGLVPAAVIDVMAGNVLRTKFALGLFEHACEARPPLDAGARLVHLELARLAASRSVVLLSNIDATLPLAAAELNSVAVIGPLADAPHDQLGTWILDGDETLSVTPRQAVGELLAGRAEVHFAAGLANSRCHQRAGFDAALACARAADVALVFVGEESILSGEAHCRADIGLPGAQAELVAAVAATGTPVVLVVMAGRPLTIGPVVEHAAAVLYAWHPGSMAGPALVDLLFGAIAPSGRLPITLPRMVGQVPVYYAHKRTGKPPTPETVVHIDAIDAGAPQLSVGNTSFHLDAGDTPLYPFGYGLSYTTFEYTDIRVNASQVEVGARIELRVSVTNTGQRAADEVVQLYVTDLVGSVTRPVRELKGFKRVHLAAGARREVSFNLMSGDLAFVGRDMRRVVEPGDFHAWIGGDSGADLRAEFTLIGEPLYLDPLS